MRRGVARAHVGERALDEHDVGRLDGHIGAAADCDAHIGLRSGRAMCMQWCVQCAYSVHAVHVCIACAVRMQCACSAHAVRMQCACSAHAVRMQCACSVHAGYTPTCASAGASLTPSPTMATTLPLACSALT
eukprot:scaffold63402_cov64-Phaeocystis_antarctica.AAC.1